MPLPKKGGTVRCPECGFENKDYTDVCEGCGSFLFSTQQRFAMYGSGVLDAIDENQIHCSSCWFVNPITEEYCKKCGLPLLHVPTGEKVPRQLKKHKSAPAKQPKEAPAADSQAEQTTDSQAAPAEENPQRTTAAEQTAQTADAQATPAAPSENAAPLETPAAENSPADQGTSAAEPQEKKRGVAYAWVGNPDKIVCPQCRYVNPKDAAECLICGQKLTPGGVVYQKTCAMCQTQNPVDAQRCILCGATFMNPVPPVRGDAVPANNPSGAVGTRRGSSSRIPASPKVICPNCGNLNSMRVTLCTSCGYRLKSMNDIISESRNDAEEPETREETPAEVAGRDIEVCMWCNHVNKKNEKYCAKCGAMLSASMDALLRKRLQREQELAELEKDRAAELTRLSKQIETEYQALRDEREKAYWELRRQKEEELSRLRKQREKEKAEKERSRAAEERRKASLEEISPVKYCSVCGAMSLSDAKFCERCGNRFSGDESVKHCIYCLGMNDKSAKFCIKCGRPFEHEAEVKYCPGCLRVNLSSAQFCVVCGKPFTDDSEEEKPEELPEAAKPEEASPQEAEPDSRDGEPDGVDK